jgi:hypothetical protein
MPVAPQSDTLHKKVLVEKPFSEKEGSTYDFTERTHVVGRLSSV